MQIRPLVVSLRQCCKLPGIPSVSQVDATAGLELLRAATVDVVIIDVDIPENEGLEVLAVVRRDLPTTKVIIVSNGYFPPPAGPLPDTVEVLSKPVGISQLRDTVHRVLGYQ